MAEYSRMAKGNFTATSSTAVVLLPFQPDYVEIWNYSIIKTAATHSVTRAWWDAKLLDGSNNPTMIELYSAATTATVFDTITNTSSNLGINPYNANLMLQYGASQQIASITKANPAVVTVTAHGYQVGDTVVMQGIALGTTNNMQLLNGVPFTITAVTTNTFTLKWDSSGSNYTAISASPAGAVVRKVLYPFLYLPEDNVVSFVTTGSTTTIATTMYHNFEVGQEIAFRIPSLWGITQLNSLPNNVIPGSPIYGYVTSITDNWTFVCNINSSSFTAYTNNFTMTSTTLLGLSYPQVLSVGDVNTGGNLITSTSSLYPPPSFPTSTNRIGTINGPAIRGAFVNNTAQGFTIGAGTAAIDGTATLIANTNIIYWHAYLHDFGSP